MMHKKRYFLTTPPYEQPHIFRLKKKGPLVKNISFTQAYIYFKWFRYKEKDYSKKGHLAKSCKIHRKIMTYEENGALNKGQIVKYTMKLFPCLYQGSDKWT